MPIKRAGLVVLLATLAGCNYERVPDAAPGSPLPGLAAADSAAFVDGRALFNHKFTPERGLGPVFNEEECSACHDLPTTGGAGADRVRKATRFINGKCDLLVEEGGDMFQNQVTPALQAHGLGAEPLPRAANGYGDIAAPPLFGAGAVEAIPDAEILERVDPDDRDGDGISGRAGRTFDGKLGRFGRKATFATLHDFVTGALSGEMGITTTSFPEESTWGGRPLPPGVDPRPEPELDDRTLAPLIRFVQLLAPSAREVPATAATRDSIRQGARAFQRAGCAQCHVPTMKTGPNSVRGLDRRVLPLYSDLLLHDMGANLAAVCAPGADPTEWRTAPLMGLRYRLHFLGQNQANSADQAVRMHGGEAEASKRRYEQLSPEEQALLRRFLVSL